MFLLFTVEQADVSTRKSCPLTTTTMVWGMPIHLKLEKEFFKPG